jgi:hypothetical protein
MVDHGYQIVAQIFQVFTLGQVMQIHASEARLDWYFVDINRNRRRVAGL